MSVRKSPPRSRSHRMPAVRTALVSVGAVLSAGLVAAGLGLAAEAAAAPAGPLTWCPGQPLPGADVHWSMDNCHTYYYVSVGLGNVGDGSMGGYNNVWEGPNPPDGPAVRVLHTWCPGQPPPQGGPVTWDMNICHTYYGVGYRQGNVGDYVWDTAGGPPPPPPQCPPIAFMCP